MSTLRSFPRPFVPISGPGTAAPGTGVLASDPTAQGGRGARTGDPVDQLERERLVRFRPQSHPLRQSPSPQSLLSDTLALSADEQLRLVARIVQALGDRAPTLGVVKIPGVVGGSACLLRTRIPVWMLEGYRRQGVTEEALLANFPTLTLTDLKSAWLYVDMNRAEIEQAIRENDEP